MCLSLKDSGGGVMRYLLILLMFFPGYSLSLTYCGGGRCEVFHDLGNNKYSYFYAYTSPKPGEYNTFEMVEYMAVFDGDVNLGGIRRIKDITTNHTVCEVTLSTIDPSKSAFSVIDCHDFKEAAKRVGIGNSIIISK